MTERKTRVKIDHTHRRKNIEASSQHRDKSSTIPVAYKQKHFLVHENPMKSQLAEESILPIPRHPKTTRKRDVALCERQFAPNDPPNYPKSLIIRQK